MRPTTKALLVVEIGVCFAPTFITLLVGIVFAPWQVLVPSELLLCAAGIVGIVALVIVTRKILQPRFRAPRPLVTIAMIGCGAAALGVFAISAFQDGIALDEFLFAYLPLLCAIHVIYLGRHYLFRLRGTP